MLSITKSNYQNGLYVSGTVKLHFGHALILLVYSYRYVFPCNDMYQIGICELYYIDICIKSRIRNNCLTLTHLRLQPWIMPEYDTYQVLNYSYWSILTPSCLQVDKFLFSRTRVGYIELIERGHTSRSGVFQSYLLFATILPLKLLLFNNHKWYNQMIISALIALLESNYDISEIRLWKPPCNLQQRVTGLDTKDYRGLICFAVKLNQSVCSV